MTGQPRVAVCFPSGDMVHADFALALAGLCAAAPPIDTPIVNAKSSIVAEARNLCVEHARAHEAGHLLFLDSDLVFPRDALRRLLERDRDIVGATYSRRTAPFTGLGTILMGGAIEDEGALVEMSRVPTGCLLIKMTVFDALSRPFFKFGVSEDHAIVGEDYDFCDRARAAGFRIWCDLKLSFELGHIGQAVHRLPTAAGD